MIVALPPRNLAVPVAGRRQARVLLTTTRSAHRVSGDGDLYHAPGSRLFWPNHFTRVGIFGQHGSISHREGRASHPTAQLRVVAAGFLRASPLSRSKYPCRRTARCAAAAGATFSTRYDLANSHWRAPRAGRYRQLMASNSWCHPMSGCQEPVSAGGSCGTSARRRVHAPLHLFSAQSFRNRSSRAEDVPAPAFVACGGTAQEPHSLPHFASPS